MRNILVKNRNSFLNMNSKSYDTLCSRVLPSPGRERVPAPRDFASVRNFSMDVQRDTRIRTYTTKRYLQNKLITEGGWND